MPAWDLPPVPDPSGEPRPPTAPRIAGPWPAERHRVRVNHHHPADDLDVAMTGRRYPLLESAAADRPPARLRTTAVGVLYAVLPVSVVMAILLWFADGDRASAYGILAAVVAGTVVLFFVQNAFDTTVILRAGAHAVGEVDSYGSGTDLPLYELREITVRKSSRGLALRIVGPNQRRLTIPFGLLEANQPLWDLVYNGIRHSEAAGAEIDAGTRRLLRLPPR